MTILPAIDLKDGKCVRLKQGRAEDETVYSDDPAAQARVWREQGADELHVVDLDGAFSGSPRHAQAVAAVIAEFGRPVEVGGGLRSMRAVEAVFAAGAARAILGSAAIDDPAFAAEAVKEFGARIAIGVDARGGMVQTRGWTETSRVPAVDLVRRMRDAGALSVIYTDTATDGMLSGPNLAQTAAICDAVPEMSVTASGGIASAADVAALVALGRANLRAAISGKALYDGTATLEELKNAARDS